MAILRRASRRLIPAETRRKAALYWVLTSQTKPTNFKEASQLQTRIQAINKGSK